jgi:hypothetical protein
LTKEDSKVSPFMSEQTIQPEIIFEPGHEFEQAQKRMQQLPPSLTPTPREANGFMRYS